MCLVRWKPLTGPTDKRDVKSFAIEGNYQGILLNLLSKILKVNIFYEDPGSLPVEESDYRNGIVAWV